MVWTLTSRFVRATTCAARAVHAATSLLAASVTIHAAAALPAMSVGVHAISHAVNGPAHGATTIRAFSMAERIATAASTVRSVLHSQFRAQLVHAFCQLFIEHLSGNCLDVDAETLRTHSGPCCRR